MVVISDVIPVVIAGCGPGSPSHVTPQVREAARMADLLAGSPRLLALFPESPAPRLAYDGGLDEFIEGLAPHLGQQRVVVLVSGDPGVASLATTLVARFPQHTFHRLAGLSSVQVAFARAGLDWMEARILHAHRGLPTWDPAWEVHRGPFAILAGDPGAAAFAADLAARLKRPAVWRCERLGLEDETADRLTADALRGEGCDPLSVLIVEGAGA